MDAINFGLGSPDNPFDFEKEKEEILERIKAAIEKGEVPPHLRTTETTKVTNRGRELSSAELEEVRQYDEFVQKMYDTCQWKQTVQFLRDRLARLPAQFDTYKLLIHAEANCGALDMAAKHAKEAYVWDPLMGEAYIMMAKIDCMAMQPDRASAWLSIAEMVPGTKEECGAQLEATRKKISSLREAVEKVLLNVSHLFQLPDFWVRLSKNVEYYRTFASDETRQIVSEIQEDPSKLRNFLKHEKIQWLVGMLGWTSAPLTYQPPDEEQLTLRHWRKVQAAQTSKFMALPSEVLLCVLDFADPPTLGRLPQVCTFWRDLLTNDHRVWKRIYLNHWDPPIIYQVPDWLWIHAFRQRYGLCLTLARVWNRRNADFNPLSPAYETNVRSFLSKFSFITPCFAESLSLIPDFTYGNVTHNVNSITRFSVREVETSEPWPKLSEQIEKLYGALQLEDCDSEDDQDDSPTSSPSYYRASTSSTSHQEEEEANEKKSKRTKKSRNKSNKNAKSSSSSSSSSSKRNEDANTPAKARARRDAEAVAQAAALAATPTSAKADPEDNGFLDSYFNHSVMQKKYTSELIIDPMRKTRNRSIPTFSFSGASSLFESSIINVCYFLLSKTDFGEESQQAAKALSALAFKNAEISHHLIQLGAIEHFGEFTLSDQYGEAADLLATLLLFKHGIAMEAAESLHSACRIFPRLWTLNVAQDLKEVQRWVCGLSGIWRGRFFLGVPGYDTPFTEHFLYLQFHHAINFGHYVPQKDLDAARADFLENGPKPKTEYRFTSSGSRTRVRKSSQTNLRSSSNSFNASSNSNTSHEGRNSEDTFPKNENGQNLEEDEDGDFAEEGNIFDGEADLQEAEARITGCGLDDFGFYKVFGRLNVAFKTIYLAKVYEFEPAESQQVYLGGDLGVWGMGGTLKSTTSIGNGVWKWWKDPTPYTIEEMDEMRLEAETAYLDSVRAYKQRQLMRHRIRTNLTRLCFPGAPGLIGEQGIMNNDAARMQQPPNVGPMDLNSLRRGLKWSEVEFSIVDAMIDPIAPPRGPDISRYNGIEANRPEYLGFVPIQHAQDEKSFENFSEKNSSSNFQSSSESSKPKLPLNEEDFVWYYPAADIAPVLKPINSAEDEEQRIRDLVHHPVAQSLNIPGPDENGPEHKIGHCDTLSRLMGWANSACQLEHMSESMYALQSFERDVESVSVPLSLHNTPPIRRFQGETDESYIRRRKLFSMFSRLAGEQRYAMVHLHRQQALIDAEYLNRSDIPWHDSRKMHITHRWIDDWLRHPIRMYVTDQARLQALLAAELLRPSVRLPMFYDVCLNEETELELVKQNTKKFEKYWNSSSNNDHYDNEEPKTNDEFSEDEDEPDTAAKRLFDNGHIIDGAADGNNQAAGWLQAGLAILTIGLVLIVGIPYLVRRNKK